MHGSEPPPQVLSSWQVCGSPVQAHPHCALQLVEFGNVAQSTQTPEHTPTAQLHPSSALQVPSSKDKSAQGVHVPSHVEKSHIHIGLKMPKPMSIQVSWVGNAAHEGTPKQVMLPPPSINSMGKSQKPSIFASAQVSE